MKNTFIMIAFASLLSSCAAYKDVEVKEVLDLRVLEFNTNGVECEIFLSVFNPNGYKITLTESHINLLFEGSLLGEVHLREKLVIPKKAQSTIALKCAAKLENLEALTGNVISLFFKSEYLMEGSGHIRGKAMFVSKRVPIEFKKTLTKSDIGF